MPIKDPEKRRAYQRERLRKLRAAGVVKVDPEKEAQRKREWYYTRGGKARVLERQDIRRSSGRKEKEIEKLKTISRPGRWKVVGNRIFIDPAKLDGGLLERDLVEMFDDLQEVRERLETKSNS